MLITASSNFPYLPVRQRKDAEPARCEGCDRPEIMVMNTICSGVSVKCLNCGKEMEWTW